MVQPAQLMATAGGRDASSASCPFTVATTVNTFASGVELTPMDVEINEHGNAILPADFYQELFRKKGDKSAKQVEEEFCVLSQPETL